MKVLQDDSGMRVAHRYQEETETSIAHLTRGALIAWLSWNDPNGCYSDEDCEAEGFAILTRADALTIAEDTIRQNA